MRIAIVGTGISGNLAARLLAQEHEIEVYEASHSIGGHTRTLDVEAFGEVWQVDTGFMVYNERTYPNFCRLLRLLGVADRDTEMSFSVRCASSGLEYQGSSLNGLFAQRRNLARPAFLGMLLDILRFNRTAAVHLDGELKDQPLGAFLEEGRYGAWFRDRYLLPMAAAIWSCPPGRVLDFPAHFTLAFLRNHGLLQLVGGPQWKTVTGSARCYVERLTAPIRGRIHTGCPIESVRRYADQVVVQPRGLSPEVFDCVVLACHADQALELLPDADDEESQLLAAFRYHPNAATLHIDTTLLPRRKRAWASWNYSVSGEPGREAAVTYDLSRLQGLPTPCPLLLTLNADESIDPNRVLDRFVFHHPVYAGNSLDAQSRLRHRNGRRRTFYCGAYCGYGFHEDGVNSALEVCKHFGLGLEQWKAVSTRELSTTSVSDLSATSSTTNFL